MNDKQARATGRRVRASITTPIGQLGLVADDVALCAILFDPEGPYSDESTHDPADADFDVDSIDEVAADQHPILGLAATQLGEYFAGERTEFDLPLTYSGTEFQRAVWDILVTIPFGATMSYGEQAAHLGDRNKARAVGAANGKNRLPIVVPCHRVVGANGTLTGFAGGVGVKSWLLAFESSRPTPTP